MTTYSGSVQNTLTFINKEDTMISRTTFKKEDIMKKVPGNIRFVPEPEDRGKSLDYFNQTIQAIRLFLFQAYKDRVQKGEHIYKVEINFDQDGNATTNLWIRDNKNKSALKYVLVKPQDLDK